MKLLLIAALLLSSVSSSAAQTAWTSLGNLYYGRCVFEAADIGNGQILVIGGSSGVPSSTDMNSLPLRSCEIIDVWQRRIFEGPELNDGRSEFAMVRERDSNLIVLGGVTGRDPFGELTQTIERYDRTRGTWETIGTLLVGRRQHSAIMLDDDRILVVGGRQRDYGTLASAEIFDLRTRISRMTTSLPAPMNYPVLMRDQANRVVVFGGRTGGANSQRFADVHTFDTLTKSWQLHSSLAIPLWLPSGAIRLWDGPIVVAGGTSADDPRNFTRVAQIEGAPTWRTIGTLATERGGSRMAQWSTDSVLVIAGIRNDGVIVGSTEWIDLATQTISPGPTLRYPRDRFYALSIPSGPMGNRRTIVVISGQPTTESITPSIEVLDGARSSSDDEEAHTRRPSLTARFDGTRIHTRLSLPRASSVDARMYTLDGRDVASALYGATLAAGEHDATIAATALPSGRYTIRATVDGDVVSATVIVVR